MNIPPNPDDPLFIQVAKAVDVLSIKEDMQKLKSLAQNEPDLPPITALILGEEASLQKLRRQVQPGFPTVLLESLKFFEFIAEVISDT